MARGSGSRGESLRSLTLRRGGSRSVVCKQICKQTAQYGLFVGDTGKDSRVEKVNDDKLFCDRMALEGIAASAFEDRLEQ